MPPDPLVLVADDDEDQRRLLERWLGMAGYRVESFGNGYSCVEALSASLPEAICLDLHIPRLTGMEALEKDRRSSSAAAGDHPEGRLPSSACRASEAHYTRPRSTRPGGHS